MKRHAGPALAAIMIALIAASLIWLKDYTPFGSGAGESEIPNIALKLHGAELLGWQNGKPAWRFQARQVEVSSDRVYTTFSDISRGVILANGEPALNLSGKRIVYHSFTHDVEASGGIKADAGERISIATDKMTWNAYRQKISCPEGVTIATPAGKGMAQSLTADLRNDSIELEKAHLRIPVEEEVFR